MNSWDEPKYSMFEELQKTLALVNNGEYYSCEVSVGCDKCGMKSNCNIFKARQLYTESN